MTPTYDRATNTNTTIQKQYDALTPEQRDEIARLSQDKDTTFRDILKAYGVLGGVVGMIKREHGLTVDSHRSKPKPIEEAKNTATQSTPKPVQAAPPTPTVKAIPTPYTVTVLKLVPSEVTLTINAASFGDAEAQALATEHVTEVLYVSKQRA